MSDAWQTGVRYIVLGSGGHAAVVMDALRCGGYPPPEGILDPDSTGWGARVDGVEVLGGDELLPDLRRRGVTHFVVGVGGARDNGPRRRVFEAATAAGLEPIPVHHSRSYIAASARVSPGAQVLCDAVVNSHAIVGDNVILNTGAVVEHDCVIGAHAHVSVRAALASGVIVSEGAHVGIGAVVIQGVTIGAGSVVGAGACVTRDVPAGAIVVGVPARPVER